MVEEETVVLVADTSPMAEGVVVGSWWKPSPVAEGWVVVRVCWTPIRGGRGRRTRHDQWRGDAGGRLWEMRTAVLVGLPLADTEKEH